MILSRAVATFGYVGLLRPAPGTWGSLAALPVFWLLHALGGPVLVLLAIALVTGIGLWSIRLEGARTGVKDASEIVIDEVAGQWIALLPVSLGAAHVSMEITALWPGWIAAFVLFRAFDIRKPGPVGWADRRPGALGVMLDDLIAGVFAGIGVVILAFIAHQVLV
ncbi:phosphatidylglycerophosphatase A family protein [Palleronia caenipelagi]|uniref:Phosphatidylglycerophosphatase A n=1 Tax=Palleronia caenipelagi TaxID=2489174 RepID=A0A547PNM3_9RHOB|nr:phosphatidylglycerophosphatase A [Palleronia caenipelagi]TRD15719.1 phosphatidylglycerophosphatase A [Palleronia caenipelagi]